MADQATPWALRAGVAVPFVYYGLQALAAPFFPGFTILRTTASELGSDLTPYGGLFNAGIMAQGALTLVAALGFFAALRRLGGNAILAGLTAAAVAMNGVQTLWAGYFPMPDPRHGGHPVFIVAMLLVPVLLPVALWRRGGPGLKAYFVATLALLAAVFPLMSGVSGLDTNAYRGLLQRVFTLAIFPPIGVAAYSLARQLRPAVPSSSP